MPHASPHSPLTPTLCLWLPGIILLPAQAATPDPPLTPPRGEGHHSGLPNRETCGGYVTMQEEYTEGLAGQVGFADQVH